LALPGVKFEKKVNIVGKSIQILMYSVKNKLVLLQFQNFIKLIVLYLLLKVVENVMVKRDIKIILINRRKYEKKMFMFVFISIV
jgi:hypothetical protein